MSWTTEAEKRMERVPSFVRNMARMAILRYAQERGHTVITERIVEDATAQLMPGHAEEAMQEIVEAHDAGELKPAPMRWSDEASKLLRTIDDLSLRGNLSMRAEKKARAEESVTVEAIHIRHFLQDTPSEQLHWQAAALARLMRVPQGFMRDKSKQRIETYAHENNHSEITLEIAEAGLSAARKAMADAGVQSKCPFAKMAGQERKPDWQQAATDRLKGIPKGFCREMTIKAVESIASQSGSDEIDADIVGQVMKTFKAGAEAVSETMPWDSDARIRISRAPDMVRGMLVKEIEGWAQRNGDERVDETAVEAVKDEWQARGVFHLDPDDHRNA